MIQWMLAIWSLVPLPFLNPAWTSRSSWFTYYWSLSYCTANRRRSGRDSDRFPLLGLQNHCWWWPQPWNQKTIDYFDCFMKAMTNLDSVLKSRDITLPTKVCLVKGMVFPVVTYSCESWTIKKAECQRINAFELWSWRRLLKVPWTGRRSNQSISREINPEYLSEGLMLKLKLQYFGHQMAYWKSPWSWKRLKAKGELGSRGWDG